MFKIKTHNKMRKTVATLAVLALLLGNFFPLISYAASLSNSASLSTNSINASTNGTQNSKNKVKQPQVKMTFNGSAVSGSKVTAIAAVAGFSSPEDELYYTWYLKRKGCELGSAATDKCDLDGDGKVTVNDWKIAATRIIVRGDFDPKDADYTTKSGDQTVETGGLEANPKWNYTWGGDNNDDDQNCYVQDTKSGNFFELRKTGSKIINECPVGYHVGCVADTTTTCNSDASKALTLRKQNTWNSKARAVKATLTAEQQANLDVDYNLHPKYDTGIASDTTTETILRNCVNDTKCQQTKQQEVLPATDPQTFVEVPDWDARATCVYNCKVANGYPADNTSTTEKMNACQVVDEGTDQGGGHWSAPASASCDTASATINDLTQFYVGVSCGANKPATCVKNNDAGLSVRNDKNEIIAHIFGKINVQVASNDVKSGITSGAYSSWDHIGDAELCSGFKADGTPGSPATYDPNTGALVTPASYTVPPILARPLEANLEIPYIGSIGQTQSTCSGIISNEYNGVHGPDGTTIVNDKSLRASCSFTKGDNICKHLFPTLPDSVNVKEVVSNTLVTRNVNTSNAKPGSGKMTMGEKEFWGADPTKTSTNGKQSDQAAIMGLGVSDFTWTYAPQDQVGVVVEGESSIASDHADSSYRIVWALPNGTCEKLDGLSADQLKSGSDSGADRSFYFEDNGGVQTGILTADVNIDDCLEENLQEPDTLGANKMQVKIDVSPNPLLDDPNGKGDVGKAIANLENVDVNAFSYEWHIEKSLSGSNIPDDQTTWIDITNKFTDTDQTTQLGKNEFNFNMNLDEKILNSGVVPGTVKDGVYYVRVKAKVEQVSGQESQYAKGISDPVKVIVQQNKILIYPAIALSNGKLRLDKGVGGVSNELSDSECDNNTCYVTKNEIVGLQFVNSSSANLSQYSWQINGTEITCDSSISDDCAALKGNILFFPVLGEVGEAINVVASAKNSTSGEVAQISKQFLIVEPSASIVSVDGSAWPKLLGHYLDAAGNPSIPDVSNKVYEAAAGSTVNLRAQFFPASIAQQIGYTWSMDGIVQENQTGGMTLTIDKPVGDTYNINLATVRSPEMKQQAVNLRNALLNHWNIRLDDTDEIEKSAELQINVVASDVPLAAASQKGLASLVTHLSEEFMFLLRISLTAFAVLLGMGLLFAFIPEPILSREDNDRY